MTYFAPTRRGFLAGSTLLPLISGGANATSRNLVACSGSVAQDLQTYIDFGIKESGGAGDNACGEWMAAELERSGFSVSRQNVSVPFFQADRIELSCGDARAEVWPHPIVIATGPQGVSGRLVRVDVVGNAQAELTGAIALVDLPFGRWSSALWPAVKIPIEAAFAGGAIAVVAITNGPSGQIIALNTDGREPMFAGPVALLAPADAGPFLAAAMNGAEATLVMSGVSGRRPAFNFLGRLDRGKGRWLVVSTPRSGWFTCAAERGPGVAAWLHIARWAAAEAQGYDLAFICNSGHEYEYLGAEEMLKAMAPKPAETAFWLHLGANLAARDWHDAVGKMRALSSTDPQRYLVVSPELLHVAKREFQGLVGLQDAYTSDALSAGELTGIIEAGYGPVAGVFGIHRFHHVHLDDERCVSAENVAETVAAFQCLVEGVLS